MEPNDENIELKSEDENNSTEELIFESPIDYSFYDEFNIDIVLNQRAAELESSRSLLNIESKPSSEKKKSSENIEKNIESAIKYEEDMDEIKKAEEYFKLLEKSKFEESNVDADNPEEVESESGNEFDPSIKESVKEKKKKASLYDWAQTEPLPMKEFDFIKDNLALNYPFTLDKFQKQAIMRLERSENVFVAAHTSAGKTVVAEYAIALGLKNNSRTVYTSPIKALSNQKYRDFCLKFGADNVGIVTGDVSVNSTAPCLIMTTEIFRSMLYKGSDTVRDIEFVIFDEVHYVNDADRGVVWEEVIIMLPNTITLIFLSATTPNALEFSEWIGRTKQKKVYLTSTNKRPVPLQHYLYFDNDAYKIMQGDSGYIAGGLQKAQNHLKNKLKPKPKTAENEKFASDRRNEKAALAAQAAGKNNAKKAQIMAKFNNPSNSKSVKGNSVISQKSGPVGGSKAQWISLLKVLQAGGREANGGLQSIDFGVGTSKGVLSKKAREEKNSMIKYENLPEELKQKMTKKEYEETEVRADEDEETNEYGLLPVVVFSFSKKRCEEIADYFKGQNLLTAKEKAKVNTLVSQVLSRLNPVDVDLPQINRLKEMLERGIGVHHGGLLPILKETVEILFSESIVKVLLATETFAMGVNMPAKSVVFNGFRKHDGKNFRDLMPGEYIQMAGRAGRRGLDKFGTVILAAWNELPAEFQLKKLLTGSATKLSSQFRLRYNMILNLVRVNNLSVEEMMKQSFTEFHAQRALSNQDISSKLRSYEKLKKYIETEFITEDEGLFRAEVKKYLELFEKLKDLHSQQIDYLKDKRKHKELESLLCQGRLVYFHDESSGCPKLGTILKLVKASSDVVVSSTKKANSDMNPLQLARAKLMGLDSTNSRPSQNSSDAYSDLEVWIFCNKHPDFVPYGHDPSNFSPVDNISMDSLSPLIGFNIENLSNHFQVIKIQPNAIAACFSRKLPIPDQINTMELSFLLNDAKEDISDSIRSKVFLFTKEFKVSSFEVVSREDALLNVLPNLSFFEREIPSLDQKYQLSYRLFKVEKKIAIIQNFISNESMSLFSDFQQRVKVLGLLGYIDKEHKVITQKGRASCELNSCDEMLGTEILFNNVFEPLNPPETAAMLSALVFQEKNDVEEALTTRMEVARTQMKDLFDKLMKLQEIEGVKVDPDAKPILNFGLCAVVYQWSRGVPFKEIMSMTEFQEGSIVRAITRLDELCRDYQKAALVIGNPALYRKMEAASECIRRDIVFAASLYIQ